jgi:DNA polymerase-1
LRTLLIDGDPIAFIIASRFQKTIDWGDGEEAHSFADEEAAKEACEMYLRRLKEDLCADKAIVAMSDPSRRYFRHDVYPQYKAHRTHGKPPAILPQIKDFLRTGCSEFPSKTVTNLEADDVLGILATHPTLVKGEKVIVAIDKDLMQIPGDHYDPLKDRHFTVSGYEGDYFFHQQVLTGDTCDGFPGCPGIGPVKAKKILSSPHWWTGIVETYQKKGLTEADALVQARVARILQHTDYDYKERKVILWKP